MPLKRALYDKKVRYSYLLIFIPLILSSYTHLWNIIGYPPIHIDESYYLRRALHVMGGFGPQEGLGSTEVVGRYDHPYFGQIFLASLLTPIGYPDSLNLKPIGLPSIIMVFAVPRVFMGLLAILDTFLIYKIAERLYNDRVALIASVLFAVTPFTLETRRIFLESIQLPFVLSSILLAVYVKDKLKSKRNILILVSGVFLGISIFTKIPAFTMMPLIGYIICANSRSNKMRNLVIWFIPVIMIPLIWPAFALSVGTFDEWVEGVMWQANRDPQPLKNSIVEVFFEVDAVLLLLGVASIIVAIIKKDLFLLLGAIPFFIFLSLIDFVSTFHFILVFPIICIASAVLVFETSKKIISGLTAVYMAIAERTNKNLEMKNRVKDGRTTVVKTVHYILPLFFILIIGAFGLLESSEKLASYKNTQYLHTVTFISKALDGNFENIVNNNSNDGNIYNDNNVTKGNNGNNNSIAVISSPQYLLIPNDVFDMDQHKYVNYFNLKALNSSLNDMGSFLLVVDRTFKNSMAENDTKSAILQSLYNNSKTIGNIGDNGDLKTLRVNSDVDLSKIIEIRANSTNKAPK